MEEYSTAKFTRAALVLGGWFPTRPSTEDAPARYRTPTPSRKNCHSPARSALFRIIPCLLRTVASEIDFHSNTLSLKSLPRSLTLAYANSITKLSQVHTRV
jgi:hypothetical protein